MGLYETPARQEINIWHLCRYRSLSTRRGSWWRFTGWMLELPSTRPSDLPTSPWQRVTIHKALCIFPWVTDCPLPHWWPRDSASKCTDEQARLQSCLYGIAQWWVANGCCTIFIGWIQHCSFIYSCGGAVNLGPYASNHFLDKTRFFLNR